MDFIKCPAASKHWVTAVSLILAGCAIVAPVEYPPDHPANPAAPAAPTAPSSSALATYKSFETNAKPAVPGNAGAGEAPTTDQPGQEGGHEHRH